MKKIKLTGLFFLVILLMAGRLMASDIPPRPNPPRLVNDFAGILTPQQQQNLEYSLRSLNDSTSNQIVVVTVKSLNGLSPDVFATELGQQWQVGQKKFDNGIVVLVKPKYGNSRGRAFIATGYGMESVVPDATAKRIVEFEMIPSFKRGDYYDGIRKATTTLMKLASGEISAKGYNKTHKSSPPIAGLIPIFVIILIFILIRVSNARSYSVGKGTSFFTAFLLGSMLGGSSHSGSWNDFSGGGGSGGGFGGGFGGFGGGSFGGGGAGGSW